MRKLLSQLRRVNFKLIVVVHEQFLALGFSIL
jgi:hypothetical protein